MMLKASSSDIQAGLLPLGVASTAIALAILAMASLAAFGVVKAPLNNHDYDVATFRRDAAYSDGRHPDTVSFTDAATDAQRRDFTINAIAYDPLTEMIIDPYTGRADLPVADAP